MNHILCCLSCVSWKCCCCLLFGGWQSWYTGSLDSQLFFQEVEDLQEGLFLELAAQGISPVTAWVWQVGTPDYFSCCSSFVLGVWEDGTSANANAASAVCGKPQPGRCCRQIVAGSEMFLGLWLRQAESSDILSSLLLLLLFSCSVVSDSLRPHGL